MSTDSLSHRQQLRVAEREKLSVNRFDSLTSLFMALILFVTVFVTVLFIIWLTSRLTFPPKVIVAPIREAGRGENAEGFERDFEPPGAEEIEELLEPTLQDSITAVTDAATSVAATLTSSNAVATATGDGQGDSRPPGPEGEGVNTVPRHERWQLNFTARDVQSYARQLDYYEIELGAIGGSIQGVDAVTNVSASPRVRRIVDTAEEKRLYFMFKTPSVLQQYDKQLLGGAGVNLAGRTTLKFIPPELEDYLVTIEMDHARENGRESVAQIAKTVFESRGTETGYAFEVVSQRYRKVPR